MEKNASPCLTQKAPYKGPGADSEEKREPASDIDTAEVDSLKALDPEWPIREADIAGLLRYVRSVPCVDVMNQALFAFMLARPARKLCLGWYDAIETPSARKPQQEDCLPASGCGTSRLAQLG